MKDDHAVLALTGNLRISEAVHVPVALDIFARIHDDHQHLITLSRDMAEAQTAAARRMLYGELRSLLAAHSHAEEAVVYDAMLRLKGSKDSRDVGNEGLVEHALFESLLERLSHTDLAGADAWKAHATVLHHMLARHIDDEERECFDALAEHFSEAQRLAMTQSYARLRAMAPRVEVAASN